MRSCPSLSQGWGRGFSCYSALFLRGRPPPTPRPGRSAFTALTAFTMSKTACLHRFETVQRW
nr:MAG TPA: hypothetical protein [Caudoviricetes sp.]